VRIARVSGASGVGGAVEQWAVHLRSGIRVAGLGATQLDRGGGGGGVAASVPAGEHLVEVN
jgi:hypothetical protein